MSFGIWTSTFPGTVQAQQNPVWFPFNGKSYFLLGVNYPWYNGYRSLDLGPYLGTKTIGSVASVSSRKETWNMPARPPHDVPDAPSSVRPGTTGFNAEGIEKQFEDMHRIGIHVLRWFFGGDGRSLMIFDGANRCTGVDSEALQNVDRVLALAKDNDVYLVPVLFDFRFVGGDSWLRYEDNSPVTGRADVIRDSDKRQALIENFIKPLVKSCANSSAILYWEIMNEAGNVVQGTDPVTGFNASRNQGPRNRPKVSVVEMQTFLNEAYEAIKSVDQTHPVMPSGLARPWQLPMVVGRVKADLYGAHYKDDGSDFDRIQPVAAIRDELFRTYKLTLDKPLVMTEGPAQLQRHLTEYLNGAFDGGWAGYLPWSYYRLIGFNDLKRYPQIVTSNPNKPQAAANIDLYHAFNRSHAAAVKLGL
jgi:Cellulase (glycosyl hydrolase family 5)